MNTMSRNKIDVKARRTKPQFFEVTNRQRELMQKNIKTPININMSKVASDAENLLKRNHRYNQVSRTKMNRMIRLQNKSQQDSRNKPYLKSFDMTHNAIALKNFEDEKTKTVASRMKSYDNWNQQSKKMEYSKLQNIHQSVGEDEKLQTLCLNTNLPSRLNNLTKLSSSMSQGLETLNAKPKLKERPQNSQAYSTLLVKDPSAQSFMKKKLSAKVV